MRAIRAATLAGGILLVGCLWAPSAVADEAAQLYDPGAIDVIELTLPKTSEETLEVEPTKDYVEGFLTLRETAGTPGTEGPPVVSGMKVGIRLKGNEGGSFRPLKTGKAAFKIKCNFVKGEKCLGLKKMTLNNMVQDPSMLHETLAYAAFRAAGVPASRTGFAYVRVNGKDFGVYLDLETLDDVSLKRLFGSFDDKAQHLYEGEQGSDVFPGGETTFEVDEGSEEDIGDLEALVEVANGEPEKGESWSGHVAPNANLAEMTKMWAVEKYIDHWDGYSGHADAEQIAKEERPNNYYLYSEPTGRFQMLPWGADQTWIPTIGVETPGREVTFDGPGGVLFNKCLEDEDCFRSYWEALRDVTNAIVALDPQSLAEDTDDLLAPWQAEEIAHGRPEYDADKIKEDKYGVESTLAFISGRRAEAEAWLDANEPPDEGEGGEGEEGEGEAGKVPSVGAGSSGGSPGASPKPAPVPGSIVIDGFHLDRGALAARIKVSGPGRVAEWVTMPTLAGRRNVCTVPDRRVSLAATVRCALSRAARHRLTDHRLRLTVNVSFAPQDGGASATASRGLTVRRAAGS